MSKRKPIEMIKNKNAPLIKMEDELSTLVQFQEKIMAEVIDRQDEVYANFLINQIITFMKENNVSTCFVLNKEELLDCLKEHNKLHYEILGLQSQLDQANERLKGLPKFGIGQKVYYVRDTTFPIEIDEIQSRQDNFFYVDYTYNEIFKESELVATREEAQELRGGE